MAATSRSATGQPAPVEIVRFRPRHMASILEIERAAFAEEPYTRAIFRELYAECGELFLVAKLRRRIAGYIATCARDGTAEVVRGFADRQLTLLAPCLCLLNLQKV